VVRGILLSGQAWSNPTKYLQQATIEMPLFDGEAPERWTQLVLPSLRPGQVHIKPEEEEYFDAPTTPDKAAPVDTDDKKVEDAFRRLVAADAPGPSGLHAVDVKEQKPQKRMHPNDRHQPAAAKRRCHGPATVARHPVTAKLSKPPLEGPLADRKLSDVDGIDEFIAKRLMEKVHD
jgi:hypothetical protein